MAYSDQIETLKNALKGFSAEEEKLSNLYQTALKNAENQYSEALKQSNTQYEMDRNTAYADNARAERNFNQVLATRGLGFSGEAAQGKLNSNITLSNRLGALEREKIKSDTDLKNRFANQKSQLDMEQAEKLGEMLQNKNKLNFDIAELELDKETSDSKLQAEKDALLLKIQADKDAAALKLQGEKDLQAAELKAEKERQATALKAEQENNAAKIQAEKDMLAAELAAKYQTVQNQGSSSSSGSGGSSGNSGNKDEETQQEEGGYIPDINANSLAKQLVKTASGGSVISEDDHEYTLNKYLLELIESYNIDSNYYNELIFMLKSYGYKERSLPEMRAQVVGHDGKAYYEQEYDKCYNEYILSGIDEGNARNMAKNDATKSQLEYMHKRSKNNTEFKMSCDEAGIPKNKANTFLYELQNKAPIVTGGSGNNTTLRVPQ